MKNLLNYWIVAIAGLILSCSNSKSQQRLSVRDFFTTTKASYYDGSLDSLQIIGRFGLDSLSTTINNIDYWTFQNSRHSFFFLDGMLRSLNDTIFILTPSSTDKETKKCREQVLFFLTVTQYIRVGQLIIPVMPQLLMETRFF